MFTKTIMKLAHKILSLKCQFDEKKHLFHAVIRFVKDLSHRHTFPHHKAQKWREAGCKKTFVHAVMPVVNGCPIYGTYLYSAHLCIFICLFLYICGVGGNSQKIFEEKYMSRFHKSSSKAGASPEQLPAFLSSDQSTR